MIRQPFKARTPEELIALLSAVATAILTAFIIMLLDLVARSSTPIASAILLSFVLAPRWTPPAHAHPARVGCRERRYNRLRRHICDGEFARQSTDATGWEFAMISIHDKREDPSVSLATPPLVGERWNARPACLRT